MRSEFSGELVVAAPRQIAVVNCYSLMLSGRCARRNPVVKARGEGSHRMVAGVVVKAGGEVEAMAGAGMCLAAMELQRKGRSTFSASIARSMDTMQIGVPRRRKAKKLIMQELMTSSQH